MLKLYLYLQNKVKNKIVKRDDIINKLKHDIQEWTEMHMPKNFVFRPNQLETIIQIIIAYYTPNISSFVLEAPTGSGKSIIAIIVAAMLNKYGKTGYILASDISLMNQYNTDFINCKLIDWGDIKGTDNYLCTQNNNTFSKGECVVNKISISEAERKMVCGKTCDYIRARNKALLAPTTLMSYSYWLLKQNSNRKLFNDFKERDFIICDEAHKIPEIVQSHFSPIIDNKIIEKLRKLSSMTLVLRLKIVAKDKNLSVPLDGNEIVNKLVDIQNKNKQSPNNGSDRFNLLQEDIKLFCEFENAINEINGALHRIVSNEDVKQIYDDIYSCVVVLENYLGYIQHSISMTKHLFGSVDSTNEDLPKEFKNLHSLISYYESLLGKLQIYLNNITTNKNQNGDINFHYIVKDYKPEQGIVLNNLDEGYLMETNFHKKCGFRVFMSATIGDINNYLKIMNINPQNCIYKKLDSTFDYSLSPIYFTEGHKMSQSRTNEDIEWLKTNICKIMDKYSTECGIIHTGSYEFMNVLKKLPYKYNKRLIFYSDSKDKNLALEAFLNTKGKILCGPSLIEGLNLYGDISRFQIFMKIPYPYLGNKLVAAKKKYMPFWYVWKTVTSIVQGVGRSIRKEGDYADTYILDGCFVDLLRYNRNSFPIDFITRLKRIDI